MEKIPYLIYSNVGTINGILKTFNGHTMMNGESIADAKQYSLSNWGVVRLDVDGSKWKYYYRGKEFSRDDLFLKSDSNNGSCH